MNKHNFLLLSPLKPSTGNKTTANRLKRLIEASYPQIVVSLVDPETITSEEDFSSFLKNRNFRAALAIHAVRSGKYLQNFSIPYALVLGGTDVNQTLSPEIKETIQNSLDKAKVVIAFTRDLSEKAMAFGTTSSKIKVIPQSAEICVSSFSLRRTFDVPFAKKVFLLPTGIRPVKDPLYILDEFYRWHQKDSEVILMIVGPVLDKEYFQIFQKKLLEYQGKGILYHGPLEREDMLAAMKESDVIINSSVSEGMASTIIEAMMLGIPVIARNNPGNAQIIQHGKNGFLFSTPEGFVEIGKLVCSCKEVRDDVVKNALEISKNQLSLERESSSYEEVVKELMGQEFLGLS